MITLGFGESQEDFDSISVWNAREAACVLAVVVNAGHAFEPKYPGLEVATNSILCYCSCRPNLLRSSESMGEERHGLLMVTRSFSTCSGLLIGQCKADW